MLPHISAPIDEAPLIPKRRRDLLDTLVVALLLGLIAVIVLAVAFLHATPMR